LGQVARQCPDVMRDDRVAVELPMTVRKQPRNRTIDLRAERFAIGRELFAPIAPPAGGASPEQLLAALGALLHFESFTRQRRARLLERRHDALPPRFALPCRLVHGLVQAPVVLAPPV